MKEEISRQVALKLLSKQVNLSENSLVTINKIFDHYIENKQDIELTTNFMKSKFGVTDRTVTLLVKSMKVFTEEYNKDED